MPARASSSAMFAGIALTSRPAPRSSSAAASSFSGRRAETVSPYPSSPSALAIASPIPLDPPVMSAARSATTISSRRRLGAGPYRPATGSLDVGLLAPGHEPPGDHEPDRHDAGADVERGLERVGEALRRRVGAEGAEDDRPEDRHSECRSEVSERLDDPGRLAPDLRGRAVERIGVERRHREPEPGAGDQHSGKRAAMAQLRELRSPQPQTDGDRSEPQRHRMLRSDFVIHPTADPGRDEERIEHRQDREPGLRGLLTDRHLEVDAPEEEDREPGEEQEQREDVVHGERAVLDERLDRDQRALRAPLERYEEGQDHEPDDDRPDRGDAVPAPRIGLLKPEHQ